MKWGLGAGGRVERGSAAKRRGRIRKVGDGKTYLASAIGSLERWQ